jgi:hypothetical protein
MATKFVHTQKISLLAVLLNLSHKYLALDVRGCSDDDDQLRYGRGLWPLQNW